MSVTRLPRRYRGEYIPAAIHPDVVIARLAKALATEGLALSNEGGRLVIHDSPGYRATGETPTGFVPHYLRWPATPSRDDGPEAA